MTTLKKSIGRENAVRSGRMCLPKPPQREQRFVIFLKIYTVFQKLCVGIRVTQTVSNFWNENENESDDDSDTENNQELEVEDNTVHFVLGRYEESMDLGSYFRNGGSSSVKSINWKIVFNYSVDHWSNLPGLRLQYESNGLTKGSNLGSKGHSFGIPDTGFFIHVLLIMYEMNLNCSITTQSKMDKLGELPVLMKQVSKDLSQFPTQELTRVLSSVCDYPVHKTGLYESYMSSRRENYTLLSTRQPSLVTTVTGPPRPRICRHFNNPNGCKLSSNDCKFSHECSKCGRKEHGRNSCKN